MAVPRKYSREQINSLYRTLLKGLKSFPSVRRDDLYETVQLEFREKKDLRDPAKIDAAVALAVQNIPKILAYVNLDPNSRFWSIDLDKDPLGQAQHQSRMQVEEPSTHKSPLIESPDSPADGHMR